jgi:hypothetical protein
MLARIEVWVLPAASAGDGLSVLGSPEPACLFASKNSASFYSGSAKPILASAGQKTFGRRQI